MDNNLKDVLTPLVIMGTFSAGLIFFVKTLTDYFLRKKMIEKGYVADDAQAIFRNHTEDNKYANLKWGLIFLFGGFSLVIMEYIPVSPDSPLPYGLFAFSIAAGFLVYFFLVKSWSNKK